MTTDSLTLGDWLQRTCRALQPVTASPEQARAEALWLLESVLGLPVSAPYAQPEMKLSADQAQAVSHLVGRRVRERVPLQYLLGESMFFGLRFAVTPAVLIPRPETELLVEEALRLCRDKGFRHVVDVGTGSGCIAVSLAHAMPELAVTAIDICPQALAVAQANAQNLGVAAQIGFCQGDVLAPVAGRRFDLIVSNPPYVSGDEAPSLMPEVLEHEPHRALFAPGDRLSVYAALAKSAPGHLSAGGQVVVELGSEMHDAVSALFYEAGFTQVAHRPDYAGHPRVLTAWGLGGTPSL